MSRKTWITMLATIVWAASEISAAADGAATGDDDASQRVREALKNIPTSGDDYTGDRLILKTHTPNFSPVRKESPKPKDKGVALSGTKLRVIQDTMDGNLTVAVVSVPCVAIQTEPKPKPAEGESQPSEMPAAATLKAADLIEWFNFVGPACASIRDVDPKLLVNLDEAYTISKSELKQHGFYRSGWVYGALLVPYKYHRHDSSFSSATTVGPYLGYQLGSIGIDVALIGSIGIASLSVPNGSGGTSSQQGYTAAIGFISTVTKNNNPLRLGLLVGKDWAGSNAPVPYVHEGKTWLAIQIGFDFTK